MDLEQLILQYEKDFFKKDFCNEKHNLDHRIHDEFMEFGQSGCVYYKDSIIDYLLNLPSDKDIDIASYTLKKMREDIVILHYISIDRGVETQAVRTSIWMKDDSDWKLYFHQGTPSTINTLIE